MFALLAWETIEGPVEGSVAMDTSSPWGQDSTEATAASPWGQEAVQTVVEQQVFPLFFFLFLFLFFFLTLFQPQEATGWADFGAFSGGGEGMEGKMEQMESTERSSVEEKEGWSPAMVSSPEATMLEESKDIKGEAEVEDPEQSNRDGGASPLLEERLKPDEQMQGAVEEEKKIGDNEAGDAVAKVAESAVAQ